MKLTQLELDVLALVAARRNPWEGTGRTTGSRSVSQAIGRLRRKGALSDLAERGFGSYGGLAVTEAGDLALISAGRKP